MSTTTSRNNLVVFRAAVSLNNMGVCTMERGHFPAALETLRDSLDVMKNIIVNPQHQSGEPVGTMSAGAATDCSYSYYLQQQLLENKVHAARRRLAFAQAQPFDVNDFIDIQPCDDGNVTAMKIPIMEVNKKDNDVGSPPVFMPIRLESFNAGDHDDHHQQEHDQVELMFSIPSAVILYNIGLTHILAHLENKKPDTRMFMTTIAAASSGTTAPRSAPPTESSSHELPLLHGGIVCFTSAHAILCKARGAAVDRPHHAVSFEILQAMLISGLVLHNLLFMFLMNDQAQTAQNVAHSLSSLLCIIQVHEDALHNMNVELENRKTACAA
jgi:hypothetical protein